VAAVVARQCVPQEQKQGKTEQNICSCEVLTPLEEGRLVSVFQYWMPFRTRELILSCHRDVWWRTNLPVRLEQVLHVLWEKPGGMSPLNGPHSTVTSVTAQV